MEGGEKGKRQKAGKGRRNDGQGLEEDGEWEWREGERVECDV